MSIPAQRRIALVTSSYAPYVGGVEQAVHHVAVGLRARGYVVEVWTVARDGRALVADDDGIPVRHLPAPLPARSVNALVDFAKTMPAAWRGWMTAFRRLRPGVVHVHCFGPNGVYGAALARRHRTPLVITSHGETLADDGGVFARSELLRVSLRCAIRRAAAVTAPSPIVLDDLRAHYGLGGGEVIPNGVDLSVRPRGGAPRGRYLFSAGRLGRMKGFDLLISAFAAAALDPDVRLVIAGDGPERDGLRRLARHLGVADRVELRGWMSAQQIADAMAGAIAVVVPSRMEAFGLVALEAWRSGAPLVMTSRGGASSFVRDGEDAILIDPEDRRAFGAVLREVAGDERLRRRLSDSGARRMPEFGWDGVVARYAETYDRAAAGGARP